MPPLPIGDNHTWNQLVAGLRCGPQLKGVALDWAHNRITCLECGGVHLISAVTGWSVPATSDIDLSRPPGGATFELTQTGFRLAAPAHPEAARVIGGVAVGLALVLLLAEVPFSFFFIVGLLVLTVMLWQTLPATMMGFAGRYEIELSASHLEIRTCVGPRKRRKQLPPAAVHSARLRQLGWLRNEPRIAVELVSANGSVFHFGTHLNHTGRAFVLRALRDHAPPIEKQ